MGQSPFALDAALQSRLRELGTYAVHRPSLVGRWLGVPGEIEWDSPVGFAGVWAPLSIAIWFPARDQDAAACVPRLLEAVDAFRAHLPVETESLQRHVIDFVRASHAEAWSPVDRQRMADAEGIITDGAILREVRSIHMRFDLTGQSILRTAWLDVLWDDEYGMNVEWDQAGQIVQPWRSGAQGHG